ncbi:hypothetical protein O3P69_000994 [Scylla paramamosain]|uniref:Uncharacterized protein n=1 Tax=Scylla paramamosain TaxID=85552 RepID=A0AAW0UTW9_SCYPA
MRRARLARRLGGRDGKQGEARRGTVPAILHLINLVSISSASPVCRKLAVEVVVVVVRGRRVTWGGEVVEEDEGGNGGGCGNIAVQCKHQHSLNPPRNALQLPCLRHQLLDQTREELLPCLERLNVTSGEAHHGGARKSQEGPRSQYTLFNLTRHPVYGGGGRHSPQQRLRDGLVVTD